MAGNSTTLTLQCIIADDEPLARTGMRNLVATVPFLHIAAEAKDAREVMQLLDIHKVDLLFLDIQMPGISGIDLARHVKHLPRIVFTTAYPEYALEGYELDVLDYLVKPITQARFLKCAYKAKAYFGQPPAATATPSFIFIKTDKKLEKVELDDILYIEARLNYVFIHTIAGRMITYASIKSMLSLLPAPALSPNATGFVKVHKSFIVSLSKIKRLEAHKLLIGDQHIPVSRTGKAALLKWIGAS